MKALITGITGFAGTHLAEHLLACGDEVLGCSRNGRWHDDVPDALKHIHLLPLDVQAAFPNEFVQCVSQFSPEVIYHLAGISVPSRCGDEKPTREAFLVNLNGAARAMRLARELPFHSRFVFISTAHVYAPQTAEKQLVDETASPNPANAYGSTKYMAEMSLPLIAGDAHFVIARAFNHAGPRQLPPLMLAEWCDKLARGRTPLVIQNDNTWLDLSDVRDVVRAYRLLAIEGENAQAYNVGSGSAVRTGEVARRLVEHALPSCPIESQSHDERHNPIADISKLQALTGWRPEIPLAQTIADTWQYWVERTAARS